MTGLNPDGLAPIPGRIVTFSVTGLNTRTVNRLIRDTVDTVIAEQVKMTAPTSMLHHATANYDRRARHCYPSKVVPAHYVHGFGTPYRDTVTARYTPTLAEVDVHYPPNMRGMDHPTTDDWLRTRVFIYDALVNALFKAGAEAVAIDGQTVPANPLLVALARTQPDNR